MFDRPEIQAFIAQSLKRSLPPRHTIVHSGESPQSLFLVLKGSVSLMLEDSNGREIVLAYLNPGEFFGEACLFPGADLNGALVRTRGATLVAEIGCSELRGFARSHPDFMFEVAAQLARRLCEVSQRVAQQTFLDVTGRLSQALRRLSHKPGALPHPNGAVVRISRVELARHIGCSREMAGRALKKLRSDGLVKDQGRNILVYGARTAALSGAA
ncbi:cyclic nucleotide-binding domain-containing protein [Fontimonas sp. SYSU GA230001]|uniref:cyclic nucleotide-binding domain-containing protein n=1 Tax=Fontimonas sp. SYSU GA230001 TaxID=3142450 RepID=UPI0032B3D95D